MKHFLNSRYEYANEWVDDVIASQFSINFVRKNDENPLFQQLWERETCLNQYVTPILAKSLIRTSASPNVAG